MYLPTKLDKSPSPVTMLKSHKKKSPNYFRRTVKCRRNVSFKEIDTEPSTGKNDGFWLLWAQPTFRRRINVVSTLWINVEIPLIPRWKWNKIRRRFLNVAQRWYNVGVRRWNNVVQRQINVVSTSHNVVSTLIITLYQRFFNVASTLFKPTIQVVRMLV